MKSQEFIVYGMSCPHCIRAVEEELKKLNLPSVKVEVGKVTVQFDPKTTDVSLIIQAIEEAGFSVKE